jgi:hypothetical protein
MGVTQYDREEATFNRGPRRLPRGIEGKLFTGRSQSFIVERLIRSVWFETRSSDPVEGMLRKLRKWVRRSGSPEMWITRIKWGLLSFLTDPTLSELHRAYLEIVLREWVEVNQCVNKGTLGNMKRLNIQDTLGELDVIGDMNDVSTEGPRFKVDVNLGGLGCIDRSRGRSSYYTCHKSGKCKNDDMSLRRKNLAPLSLSQ